MLGFYTINDYGGICGHPFNQTIGGFVLDIPFHIYPKSKPLKSRIKPFKIHSNKFQYTLDTSQTLPYNIHMAEKYLPTYSTHFPYLLPDYKGSEYDRPSPKTKLSTL